MTRRSVLVTGVTGFVGRAVASEFANNGWSVVGLGRDAEAGASATWLSDYIMGDLIGLRRGLPPVDAIVHLAGLADVGGSFVDPQRYITQNSAMMTSVCEQLLSSPNGETRLLAVSSGSVYAEPLDNRPLKETDSLGFASPYAVSKVLVENQLSYYRRRGIDGVVARPFNHFGPGQRGGFLVPDLISAIASAVEKGSPVQVGDLGTVRDYADVRDIARAYRLLIETPRLDHLVYNVCSGRGTSGKEILTALLETTGTTHLTISTDESRLRPTDPRKIVGDPSRIRDELGWSTAISLNETIAAAAARAHN
jgi:GDP-4-dehydro-6-deoxy-D-mannose reductase